MLGLVAFSEIPRNNHSRMRKNVSGKNTKYELGEKKNTTNISKHLYPVFGILSYLPPLAPFTTFLVV